MISTGYCPRGPFCAFAHIEQEMKNQRAHSNSESSNSDYTLENFISNVLPNSKDADHDQYVCICNPYSSPYFGKWKENQTFVKEKSDLSAFFQFMFMFWRYCKFILFIQFISR